MPKTTYLQKVKEEKTTTPDALAPKVQELFDNGSNEGNYAEA
jgi:hypothetical protein